jgi:DNA-binding CsgD family transcriptional regulator
MRDERGKMSAAAVRVIDELRTAFTGDSDGLRRHALVRLCELGEASDAVWYEFGQVDGRVLPTRWLTRGPANTPALMERWSREGLGWLHTDPNRLPRDWLGRFRCTSRSIREPERTFYPTPFYQRVVAPARISDQLRMFVSHRGQLVAWIGVMRFEGDNDFVRRDERRVSPIAAALSDALVGAYAADRRGQPEEGCDLVLTPTGRVELASRSAQALADDEGAREALKRWVREVDAGGASAPVICGMALRWTRLHASDRVRYLLHLDRAAPVRLGAVTDLSPTQRSVAELACAGLTAPEIGAQLSIKPSTIRAHLKAIYMRLEVSSRAELARALASPNG